MAECCTELGYAETTLERVIERAGVEQASFEAHFSGKEDCALAALNKIISETLAQVSMSGTAGEAVERRGREVKAILDLLVAQAPFADLAFIDARQGGTGRMHDSYESAARVLALMMERAAGGEGAYPNTAARAALGGAEAVVRRELAAGRSAGLPQLLSDFVYAALVPFVGQGEALRQAKLAAEAAVEEG